MRRTDERVGGPDVLDRLATEEFGDQPPTRDEPRLERPAEKRIAPPRAEFKLRMWSYDIAREQCPTLDHLRTFARLTEDSGYNALGLYLEHRFAYECAPWANGVGAVDASMIRTLQREFHALKFIPMINLLGHMEGFIYTEYGSRFAEERFKGLQACPSNPEFVWLCEQMVDEIMSVFDSDIIHIGGDEAKQLGKCPACAERVASFEFDGRAGLYCEHFVPLCERVLRARRRPAVWGDMMLEHPRAELPRETLVFDWQYHSGVRDSATQLLARGYEVVGCPSLQTFNAPWTHLRESEENVREVVSDAVDLDLFGICLTTWECGLFGAYDTLFPAIRNVGEHLNSNPLDFLASYGNSRNWANQMGVNLPTCGGVFAYKRLRSQMRTRFLLHSNPFLLWLHHRDSICGSSGKEAHFLCDRATTEAHSRAERDIAAFCMHAIQFVWDVEEARQMYETQDFLRSAKQLEKTTEHFLLLIEIARMHHQRIGGSLSDIDRCQQCILQVEVAASRIRKMQHQEASFLPSFEHLVHPKFTPHDQGAWWRINQWADE